MIGNKICSLLILYFSALIVNTESEDCPATCSTVTLSNYWSTKGYTINELKEFKITTFFAIRYGTTPRGRFTNPTAFQNPTSDNQVNRFHPLFCPSYYSVKQLQKTNSLSAQRSLQDRFSEDCLNLDIYARAESMEITDYTVPVVVVFADPKSDFSSYLKGYSEFMSHLITNLEAIVVKVNYRNGPLGFLQVDDEDNGNFGLKDQKLALEFIQKHILSYGGDKNQVVVLAEGSAASGIGWHLTNSANLFSNYILLGGSPSSVLNSEYCKKKLT